MVKIALLTGLFICPIFVAADESLEQEIAQGISLLGTRREAEGVSQLEKSLKKLRSTVKESPESAQTQYQLGRVQFYLAKDDSGLAAFEETIRLEPGHAPAHYFKGIIARRSERLDEAQKELELAKAIDPKKACYWAEFGDLLLERNDTSGVRRSLETAVQLDPKDSSSLFSLGVIDSEEGRLVQSIQNMRKVIALDPEAVNAYYNAGQSSQSLGKIEDSVGFFAQAAKLEPNDERVAAKLVQCYQALNRLEDRDNARRSILELHKNGKTERELYCRDQFVASDLEVMVLEYFDMKGDEAVRYSFQVREKGNDKPSYRISLGSYDVTNEFAQAKNPLPKNQRYFHLDRYFPSGKHETFGFYKGEPSYDKVRTSVIDIIAKKTQPTSSMTPTSQGSEIEIDD